MTIVWTRAARKLGQSVIVLSASALILVGLAAPASAADDFTDVEPSHLFYTHITWLAESGITSGVGDGSAFAPDAPVTRGQMAVFLYKLAGSPPYTPPKESPFDDVATTDLFYKHITWLANEGITSGVGDGSRFAPSASVTRGQMAVFIYKVAGSPDFDAPPKSPFGDVPITNAFYRHITWLSDTGITSGVGDGSNFAPTVAVSRGQMAVFLFKYVHIVRPSGRIQISPNPSSESSCRLDSSVFDLPSGATNYLIAGELRSRPDDPWSEFRFAQSDSIYFVVSRTAEVRFLSLGYSIDNNATWTLVRTQIDDPTGCVNLVEK